MWISALLMLAMAQTPKDGESAKFEARAKDWRMGAIVYQVFVDRFAPSQSLEAKKKIIVAPRKLKEWSETPMPSKYDPKIGYPHVLEFWGGDLKSVQSKLDYIDSVGADVLYLTPIFKSYSNHKYDTENYKAIAPEFGTRQDLLDLIADVHKRGKRIMLDGVFNHIGKTSPIFQEAQRGAKSRYRDWFTFGKEFSSGYKGWYGGAEMPALRLENPAVRDYLWNAQDSVMRSYLRDGIDGWRLDVAYDIGPRYLAEATKAAHETKAGSAVVGEISGYPANWFGAVDGVFNFHSMQVIINMLNTEISGGRAGQMLARVTQDAGIENLLRSWLQIDNHDTPRAADTIADRSLRRLAQALLFTLPGSPVIYYGSELGMHGEGDPQNRAPMRWDLANDKNPDLTWVRQLTRLRKKYPALRYGDFQALDTDSLLAFTRTTDKMGETVLVVVNPNNETTRETFATRVGRILSWGDMEDVLTGDKLPSKTGLLSVSMQARSVRIFVPSLKSFSGYSPFLRIP